MRRGELLNCTWSDVDLAAQTLTVSPKEDTEQTWGWLIKDLDRRTLPLTDEVVQILADHQNQQPEGHPYLRRALHLDELHILGHSCGSTFLIEYMVTRKPKGVRSVIFSSPMISTPIWMDDAKILLAQLPESVQDTIKKYEAVQDYSAAEYLAATDEFYARYLTRKGWPPPETDECKGVPQFNEEIYNYMWGPTEFTATGTLKSFDRTADLHTIKQPILFIAGDYDEARPETMYEFQALCKNASVAIIDDAAHMTMIDQPEKVAEVIRRFLRNVEGE